MSFHDKLDTIIEKNNSLLSVGFDPVLEKIPSFLKEKQYPFFEFNKAIIDTTHDLVCAYKFNSAFYEAIGEKGIKELKLTYEYLMNTYPEIPTILDAKRGDIGSSNEAYEQYAFDYMQSDSVTLNPYLGKQPLQPFLNKKEKGCVILCKTSNPGGDEIQNLLVQNSSGEAEELYKVIAKKVVDEWNINKNCLFVIGATYPEELAQIRRITNEMTFLTPGIGAQGGDVKAMVTAGLNSEKKGLIIVVVRSIIYASNGEDFAQKSREEALKLRDEINKYR